MSDNYLVILYCERCKRWSQTQITTVTRCPFCGLEIKEGRQFLRIENKRRTPMDDDLISRAAEIGAIRDMCEECDSSYCGECRVSFPGRKDCEKVLEGLPLAHPEIEERKEESAQNVPNDELISRKAAIDALGEEPEVWTGNDEYAQGLNNQWRHDVKALKGLPPAQPFVIHCTDCRDWYKRQSVWNVAISELSNVEPEPSQVARDIATILENEKDMRVILSQPERKKGRWHYSDGKPAIIGRSFGVICDQCGTESEYCTNFCGECGADMREDIDAV